MAGILNIQMAPVIGDKITNLQKVEQFITEYSDKQLDLVILPEFFSTGIDHDSFVNSPEPTDGGNTIKTISNLAKKFNTNIVAGTVIEKENDKLYNTTFVINRNGDVVEKYRKIHLYNYLGGKEGEIITAGNEIKTVDLDFGKIGLAICFDIRYPLHYKTLAKMGVDIIVLPTAWVVPNEVFEDKQNFDIAQDVWKAINKTRAYDNLVYTICSNQIGRCNENISCIGNSMIVAPTSEILANAETKQGGIYANIDLDIVKLYKSIYPIATID